MNTPSTPLVEVKDAARWFDVSAPWLERMLSRKPKTMLRAVDGVSFTIRRGETLALVGESGCGKSTIARLLVGLYPLTRGSIDFDGQPLEDMNGPNGLAIRRRLQMIFQDPFASLNPRWRVGRIIAEPLLAHTNMTPQEREARVDELLVQVGLHPTDKDRYPHQFSGGQRQRISIARALAVDPTVLLMDEPFAALDAQNRSMMQQEMIRILNEESKTVVLVTHSIEEAINLSDVIVVMTRRPGRVKATIRVPRPRQMAEESDEYQALKNQIRDLISNEQDLSDIT